MPELTLADLDAVRIKYGCGSDSSGSTLKHAACWSKKVLAGTIPLPPGLAVPAHGAECPRHAPLLNALKEKLKSRNFSWFKKECARSDHTAQCIQFLNYPGADKGSMLTLADLWILPVETIDEYIELYSKVCKSAPRKTKRRPGAGVYNPAWNTEASRPSQHPTV